MALSCQSAAGHLGPVLVEVQAMAPSGHAQPIDHHLDARRPPAGARFPVASDVTGASGERPDGVATILPLRFDQNGWCIVPAGSLKAGCATAPRRRTRR